MALEIERKFLVKNDGYKQMASNSIFISQGYLSRDPQRTVRIRIRDDKGFITVKGITKGAVREEYEYEIPADDARDMLKLCDGHIVEKRRWYVNFEGHLWEVDEFAGSLAPLTVAEIELPSADTSFGRPPFIGREVTGDPHYYNSNL